MRRNLFWLSDGQWRRIEPHLPTDVRGVERADDRRVISGIVHVLKCGCRWCECATEYGPPTTIYNRFVRWAERGIWENLFRALVGDGRSAALPRSSTHLYQSTSFGCRSKRGEQKQAVGCFAAGETRKFTHSQMLKGRLLAILLTGGEAHDCPIAQRLIRRVKRSKHMLGDKAYNNANCVTTWTSVEPIRSFPTRATESSRSASINAFISYDGASKPPSID